jgi:hypothetical protein
MQTYDAAFLLFQARKTAASFKVHAGVDSAAQDGGIMERISRLKIVLL